MTHQQALDKLAAQHLVQSIDEDLARLTAYVMAVYKNEKPDSLAKKVLTPLLLRWNCVLEAGDETATPIYRQKTILALAILLHKYGFVHKEITAKAIKAIDELNDGVVLSDDFFRKSKEIKTFISSAPEPLKRKPGMPDSISFYRAKDVIAIQLDKKFYAAYIHRLARPNESPVIEFYNGVFSQVPAMAELQGLTAKGAKYNDGVERIEMYSVSGLKFLPDLANQVTLVSACVSEPPSNKQLEKPVGLYTVSDIFDIQDTIKQLFR